LLKRAAVIDHGYNRCQLPPCYSDPQLAFAAEAAELLITDL